jgi:hypothetical protein
VRQSTVRVVALVVVLAACLHAQERPLPDYAAFAAQVRTHLATDEERQSGYTFLERRVQQKVNGAGRVTDESSKLFEVYPGIGSEGRYYRLIEEDGKAVPAAKLAKLDGARQKRAEAYAQSLQRPRDREQQARAYEKARREYDDAIDDIFRVYDIAMVRREPIDGHDTILATLTPKPRVRARTDSGRIMQHFRAKAWVSESDYELVRVEIEAIDTLSFGLGLLARVDKGTVGMYQRRKVNNEVWLPAQVTWTASGRMFLVRRLRLRGVSEFSNYRKFVVETATTVSAPQ